MKVGEASLRDFACVHLSLVDGADILLIYFRRSTEVNSVMTFLSSSLNKRFARYSLAKNFVEAVKTEIQVSNLFWRRCLPTTLWAESPSIFLDKKIEGDSARRVSSDLHNFEITLPFYLPHLHCCTWLRNELPLTFNWGALSRRNIKCFYSQQWTKSTEFSLAQGG